MLDPNNPLVKKLNAGLYPAKGPTAAQNAASSARYARVPAAPVAPVGGVTMGRTAPTAIVKPVGGVTMGRNAPTKPAGPTAAQNAASTARYSKPQPVVAKVAPKPVVTKPVATKPVLTKAGLTTAKNKVTTKAAPAKPKAVVKAPAAVVKPKMTWDQWSDKDTDYKNEMQGYMDAWNAYQNEFAQGGQTAGTDYQEAYRRLFGYTPTTSILDKDGNAVSLAGSGDPNERGGALKEAYDSMVNDYAGRGLYGSGLYLQDEGKLNENYQQQKADLDLGYQRSTAESSAALTAQRAAYEQAKRNAAAASAARGANAGYTF